jgi:hypothetical protein
MTVTVQHAVTEIIDWLAKKSHGRGTGHCGR